jgi:hypothetical protein
VGRDARPASGWNFKRRITAGGVVSGTASILVRILEIAVDLRLLQPDSLYRFQARRLGVKYLGTFEKHRLALFQDPVTGSSFAVRVGEPVESGIRRVRSKFGLSF